MRIIPHSQSGFVTTQDNRFVLNGAPFPAVGVNCYFLTWCDDAAREATLTAIEPTGSNVIRAMAFLNAPERPVSGACFQYGSGGDIVINDGADGLERLDAFIAAAARHNFRLILPLVNYWDDLGGMRTYLDWLFPGQKLPREEFYRRPEARAAFKNWIAHVLSRTADGVLYRESPAIFAWELANEPRCSLPGGRELLLDWAGDISAFIKQQDPNHLVALGDEGFLGESALALPGMDFGCCHFYPGHNHNVPLDSAAKWIADQVAAGARAGKPVLLEEYGLPASAGRDAEYARWQQAVYDSGGAGDLLWTMGSEYPAAAGYRDDYTVYSAAEIPSLRLHAEAMQRRDATLSPKTP